MGPGGGRLYGQTMGRLLPSLVLLATITSGAILGGIGSKTRLQCNRHLLSIRSNGGNGLEKHWLAIHRRSSPSNELATKPRSRGQFWSKRTISKTWRQLPRTLIDQRNQPGTQNR